MMGPRKEEQPALLYEFSFEDHVPEDHLLRSIDLRKKVEMLFAHLKRIIGLGRLPLRGPCGAKDEFLLATTTLNLRKLAKVCPALQKPRNA